MWAVVVEIADDVAGNLLIIGVFYTELIVQAMRRREQVGLSVVCRIVDECAGAPYCPVDDQQEDAALDIIVSCCRILIAGYRRHAPIGRLVGYRFGHPEVAIAVIHFADGESAGKSGIGRFLIFDDQFVARNRGDWQ